MNFQIDKNVSEDFKESVPFYDAIKLTQGGTKAPTSLTVAPTPVKAVEAPAPKVVAQVKPALAPKPEEKASVEDITFEEPKIVETENFIAV